MLRDNAYCVMRDGAPEPLKEWVGRADLLQPITADWTSGSKHITGLIGSGGEGKSSLARKWVDDTCGGNARIAPTNLTP
jgi:hypothetical protein